MSHVTDVKLKVHDLDALSEACDQLGLELMQGQKTYAWWGSFQNDSNAYGEHRPAEMGKCEHAIRIKGDKPKNGSGGPWEIAVVAAKDGSGFGLYYDTFGHAGARLSERVGQNANKLRQEYSVAVATRKAKATLARKGWRVMREELPGQRVRLKLRKR